MDQIMNYSKKEVISNLETESNLNGKKVAAGCPSSQVSNNKETTLKSCRQRQMASDIFGVGMDKAWNAVPENGSKIAEPLAEDPAPLDLTQTDNNSENNDDSPVSLDDPAAAVSTIESTVDETEELAVVEDPAVVVEPAGPVEKEAPKTGKRHFEGKNDITKFW